MDYRNIDVDQINDLDQLKEIHGELKEEFERLYGETLDVSSNSRDADDKLIELMRENEQLKRGLELAEYRMMSLPQYKAQEQNQKINQIFRSAKITR